MTIAVTNVAEIGSITLSPEGPPTIGAAITATLSDPDGGVTRAAWQWQRSDGSTAWADIEGASSESYTPVDSDADMRLRAKVTYADRAGSGIKLESEATEPVSATARTPAAGATLEPALPAPELERGGIPFWLWIIVALLIIGLIIVAIRRWMRRLQAGGRA